MNDIIVNPDKFQAMNMRCDKNMILMQITQ